MKFIWYREIFHIQFESNGWNSQGFYEHWSDFEYVCWVSFFSLAAISRQDLRDKLMKERTLKRMYSK